MNSPIFHLFCQNQECSCYKKTGSIWKNGTYTTVSDSTPRQRFKCAICGHTFSETSFSELYGKHGTFKEYEQCYKLLTYNLHPNDIADVLYKNKRTIL